MFERILLLLTTVGLLLGATAEAADLKAGTPDLKSASQLAFGPDGILFVGDTQGAAVFAIDTADHSPSSSTGPLNVLGINEKIAALLGTTAQDILITDLAVNPLSQNVYLSVSRGRGPDAVPVLLRVKRDGELEALALENVKFSKVTLPNPPSAGATDRRRRSLRAQSITDLAYVDGRLFIAGLSNEEFASNLRSIPFPFSDTNDGTGVEIYHGAHGRFETRSPIRTFVSYEIQDEPYLLAAYTCTPLVRFPVSQLKPGSRLRGTTVAELGNGNRPLDMIVYNKDGRNFLLLANSRRGVMKITTQYVDKVDGITKKIQGGARAGLAYETIEELKGVEQLDRLDQGHALLLVRSQSGSLDLRTVALP